MSTYFFSAEEKSNLSAEKVSRQFCFSIYVLSQENSYLSVEEVTSSSSVVINNFSQEMNAAWKMKHNCRVLPPMNLHLKCFFNYRLGTQRDLICLLMSL